MEEEIIGNRWKELGGVGHSGKSRMRARDPPPLTSSLPRHKNHTINPKKPIIISFLRFLLLGFLSDSCLGEWKSLDSS